MYMYIPTSMLNRTCIHRHKDGEKAMAKASLEQWAQTVTSYLNSHVARPHPLNQEIGLVTLECLLGCSTTRWSRKCSNMATCVCHHTLSLLKGGVWVQIILPSKLTCLGTYVGTVRIYVHVCICTYMYIQKLYMYMYMYIQYTSDKRYKANAFVFCVNAFVSLYKPFNYV